MPLDIFLRQLSTANMLILSLMFPFLVAGRQYGDVLPHALALGQTRTINANTPYGNQTLVLSPDSPVLTIDYGLESAGFPFFDVLDVSGPAQIEVKYAESFVSLESPYSDGKTSSKGLRGGLYTSLRSRIFCLGFC